MRALPSLSTAGARLSDTEYELLFHCALAAESEFDGFAETQHNRVTMRRGADHLYVNDVWMLRTRCSLLSYCHDAKCCVG